jgi:hypothetical protein
MGMHRARTTQARPSASDQAMMSAGVIMIFGVWDDVGLQQFHLLRVVHLALDLIGDCFADAALHFELGGCAVQHGDAQTDGELAVFIGGVFGFALMGGKQFTNVVEGLILEGLVGVHGGVWRVV